MCGICGIATVVPGRPIDRDEVRAMMARIAHRGPDDEGMFAASQAVLGHRRLSIIDLASGKQPIGNEDGSLQIVFNGEIYNYRELRADLVARGHRFRTESDTEVIVHLYEEYGADCVSRLNGMFAFAIWDERDRSLFLARDRVGIKPLYYAVAGDRLYFASEIKALLVCPDVERAVDPQAIDDFLTYLYLPGERTMLERVKKLLPGHWLRLRGGEVTVREYWDLAFTDLRHGRGEASLREELIALLEDVVRGHMIADVPVGVLLSGGVDSTAMLSFVVENTAQRIDSFTIGFSGENFADERPYARLAAQRFGSTHHEISMSAEDFWSFLPDYAWHMEEPVCEPPAIALHYVTKFARDRVKVLISGEGGDEAFAGYQNYRNLVWLERLKRGGRGARGVLGYAFDLVGGRRPEQRWHRYALASRQPLSSYYYSRTAGPHSPLASARNSLYTPAFRDSLGGYDAAGSAHALFARVGRRPVLDQMLYVDTKTWLPDDLLLKADKITMGNSLELRVPLLDHRVLEFAASLDPSMKLNRFETKYLLKQTLRERVPQAILERPKTGFPVPFERWLQGPLRDRAHALLLGPSSRVCRYIEAPALTRLLQSKGGQAQTVFSMLALELWHRQFDSPAQPRKLALEAL